ncbi:hypothetical protein GX48_08387 [Paracoccidioides brasiliensis]|nr:hypothetical protein GX48_08387 [Paracoccidioides brasiliensis]
MGPKPNPRTDTEHVNLMKKCGLTSERNTEAPHTSIGEEIQAVEHERERLEIYKKLLDLQQQVNTLRAEIQASESNQRDTEPTDHTISANLPYLKFTSAAIRELRNEFKAKNLEELEDFISSSLAFYAYQKQYFENIDEHKILEAATHFDANLPQKWQQYYTNLKTPITWSELYNWIHARLINPDKANQDYELKYQELKQSEGQTIHDFVFALQSIERNLRQKYSDYHRKVHLFNKILSSLRAEFERYAVKLDDLSYDAFIMKLGIVESNILKTTTPSSATTQ